MSEYVNLATLLEDPIARFKAELETLGIFAEINEGEEIYSGTRPWAQVIPGTDRIRLEGNQQLMHEAEIYVLFLRGASDSSLASLRKTAQAGYDKLMEDQTHNGTCWSCLPNYWAPGFFSIDQYNFAGVQTRWIAKNYQTFPLPDNLGADYPDMQLVVEEVLAAIKDEIYEVPAIDEINEGETVYTGEGTVAWVIPGPDRISSNQRARLNHDMTIYVNLLTSKNISFAEMRNIGQEVYDAMMVDITHGENCNYCLPVSWIPGFVRYGDQSIIGVQATWTARIQQSYTPT